MKKFWEFLFWRKAIVFEVTGDKCHFNIHGHGHRHSASLGDEERLWCRANIKKPHGIGVGWYGDEDWMGLDELVVTMWFIDPKEAALFKLFWM